MNRRARLDVYWYAHKARLIESLEDDYGIARKTLGKKRFWKLAEDYIEKNKPIHPGLADFSKKFPNFIKKHFLAKQYPFLHDACLFEWNAIRAYYSEEEKTLDVTKVSSNRLPQTFLKLKSQIIFFSSHYPIHKLITAKRILRATVRKEQSYYYLFFNKNGISTWIQLETHEYKMFQKLKTGLTVEDSTKYLSRFNLSAQQYEKTFQKLSQHQLISSAKA